MGLYIRGATVAALIAALAGCGRNATTSVAQREAVMEQQTVANTTYGEGNMGTQAAARPMVPAGTQFTIALEDNIGTQESEQGEEFTARVTGAVRAADGRVVIEEGATLRGRVARIEGGARPTVALEFTSIDTTEGAAPVTLSIRDVPQYDQINTEGATQSAEGRHATVYLDVGAQGSAVGGGPNQGGSRTQGGAQTGDMSTGFSKPLLLPEGTQLQVQLGAPLYLPED